MNVTIRRWQLEDAADLAAILNNKNILNNLRDGIPFPYTEADAASFISGCLGAEPDSSYDFAIVADDLVAGAIGVARQANIHRRTAEMGYYVAEGFWGRGVATAAVRLACRYVFDNTDIVRIFAEPFARNIASCRVLEKAGFLCEGTLRSNAYKNGEVIDMLMYSLIG